MRITGVRRVRAAPAHYFSTHGSSRFGAEDAAIVGMFPRDLARSKSWEVKKDHNTHETTQSSGSTRWPLWSTEVCSMAWRVPSTASGTASTSTSSAAPFLPRHLHGQSR